MAGGEAETSDRPFSTLLPSTTITTEDQANVAASPKRVQVEGQEERKPPLGEGDEAETSTRSVSTPSTTTTPELVIDMTLNDQDTSDRVDMVSPTPPPQQLSCHSSRPPPVAGGVAEPKECESPPTTITTPEVSVVVQVAPDGSRPPPVVGGAAEPKESESPPTTITTPELSVVVQVASDGSRPSSGRRCG